MFLDRDGVVIKETPYLSDPRRVVLVAGAGEAIARLNAAAWHVVLVTNQSGIGRQYFGWAGFAAVQQRLRDLLSAHDAAFDMVLACPFHPDAIGRHRQPDHPWRKPLPGMLLAAAERLRIDRGRSWIVGDRASDIAAGRSAGLAGAFHAGTGHGPLYRSGALALATPAFPVVPVTSLAEVPGRLANDSPAT